MAADGELRGRIVQGSDRIRAGPSDRWTVVSVAGLRRMISDEWRELRRVQALMVLDSPGAFDPATSSTQGWDAQAWARWCESLAESEFEAGWCVGAHSAWEALIVASLVVEDAGDSVGWGWLWVTPGRRHRGVATALINEVHNWALDLDVDRCFLWVAEHNESARRLYRRLGYHPTDCWIPTTMPGRGEERWEIMLDG
jgi:GNAT superfamily N-acetyltransferase